MRINFSKCRGTIECFLFRRGSFLVNHRYRNEPMMNCFLADMAGTGLPVYIFRLRCLRNAVSQNTWICVETMALGEPNRLFPYGRSHLSLNVDTKQYRKVHFISISFLTIEWLWCTFDRNYLAFIVLLDFLTPTLIKVHWYRQLSMQPLTEIRWRANRLVPLYSSDIDSFDYHLFRTKTHSQADEHFRSFEETKHWIVWCIAWKDGHVSGAESIYDQKYGTNVVTGMDITINEDCVAIFINLKFGRKSGLSLWFIHLIKIIVTLFVVRRGILGGNFSMSRMKKFWGALL